MARRTKLSINAMRYILFAFGAMFLYGHRSQDWGSVDIWALAVVIACFPYGLIALVFRPFRKRKPVPVPRVRVEVSCETSGVAWGDELATEKQLGFIRHLGGDPPEGLTKSAASEMIDALLVDKNERLLARAEFKRDRKANAAKSSFTRISLP